MSERGSFHIEPSGNSVWGAYSTSDGTRTGARVPMDVVTRLAWQRPVKRDQFGEASEDDSAALLRRLRGTPSVLELSEDDLSLVSRAANADLLDELARLLRSSRPEELDHTQRRHHTRVAGVVARLNASDERAAGILVDSLHQGGASAQTAAHAIGDALRPPVATSAMRMLLDGVLRLLDAHGAVGWPRLGYPCIGPMLSAAHTDTRRRAREELRSISEEDRLWLLSAIARCRTSESAALLRTHFDSESSSRLRLRLMVDLGSLVRVRARRAALGAALADESAWWRWQAIQELWRISSSPARELLSGALPAEPDPLLRDLMLAATDALDLPETRARRLSVYG